MSNDIPIAVKGRAGGPPTFSKNGKPFTRFRLATNRRTRNAQGEWIDHPTQWFTVKCWNDLAVNVATSLKSGTPVLVRGVLEEGTYTNADGASVTEQVVNADAVAVELAHGTVVYSKAVRDKSDQADGASESAADPSQAPPPDETGWGAGGDVSGTPVPAGVGSGTDPAEPPF